MKCLREENMLRIVGVPIDPVRIVKRASMNTRKSIKPLKRVVKASSTTFTEVAVDHFATAFGSVFVDAWIPAANDQGR